MKQTITRILPNWHQDCGLIDSRNPNVFEWAKGQKDQELLYIAEQIAVGNATVNRGFKKLATPRNDPDWQLTVEVNWIEAEEYILAKLKFGN